MPVKPGDIYGLNAVGSRRKDDCKYRCVNGGFANVGIREENTDMCSQFSTQAGMSGGEMKTCRKTHFPARISRKRVPV